MKNSLVLLAVIIALLATWTLAGIVGNTLLELPTQELVSTMKSQGMIYFMLVFGWIPALCIGVDVHNSFKKTADNFTPHSAAELEFVETELPENLKRALYDFLEDQQPKDLEKALETFLEDQAIKARDERDSKQRIRNVLRSDITPGAN